MRAMMLCILLVVLAGCAHPYWVKDAAPVTPTDEAIISQANMDVAFGSGKWAVFDRGTGITYVSDDAPLAARDCIRSHEIKHAMGWNHEPGQRPFVDCGDGTWISAETLRRR